MSNLGDEISKVLQQNLVDPIKERFDQQQKTIDELQKKQSRMVIIIVLIMLVHIVALFIIVN